MRIHVHHHYDAGELSEVKHLLGRVLYNLEKVLMTQKEATDALNKLRDELVKANTEIQGKIDALVAAAANAPVSPELQAAIDGVSVAGKVLDDIVPDQPTP